MSCSKVLAPASPARVPVLPLSIAVCCYGSVSHGDLNRSCCSRWFCVWLAQKSARASASINPRRHYCLSSFRGDRDCRSRSSGSDEGLCCASHGTRERQHCRWMESFGVDVESREDRLPGLCRNQDPVVYLEYFCHGDHCDRC